MNKRLIIYILLGVLIVSLVLASFNIKFGDKISGNIPEECRLPAGQNLEGWKEHLGHHQNTLYCLDYYE